VAKHDAAANTKKAHNNFFIFSLPQTSNPYSHASHEFLKRLRRLAEANCCERVYDEWVEKHKGNACGNLPYFQQSFGCNASASGNAPAGLHDGKMRCQLL
jgi:hypothetical protein